MELIDVQDVRNLLVLASVSAFLTCSIAFAQMFAPAAEGWRDSWNSTDPEGIRTATEAEMDRGHARPRVIRPEVPGIVTLHELAHKIPREAEREYKRAWAAQDKGDRQAAIMDFQKAIAIDPEFWTALNDLGTGYLQTGQLDLAIEQFNKAIAVDPHGAKPYSNLAVAYVIKGHYRDAERAARHALDLDRTGTHGHLGLGISLVLQEKVTEETERSLSKAAVDYPCANLWLAIGLLRKGEIETARNQLNVYFARGEKAGMEIARTVMQQLELLANYKR
jgi:tetratricopeptide (TPR) repeat protein